MPKFEAGHSWHPARAVCCLKVAEPIRSSVSQERLVAKGRLWAGGRRRTDDEGTEWWGDADSTPQTTSFRQWWTSGSLFVPILSPQDPPRPSSGDCASFEVVYMFTLATNCSLRLPFLCKLGTPLLCCSINNRPRQRDGQFDWLNELTRHVAWGWCQVHHRLPKAY